MKLVKIILFIIATILLIKSVNNENFDDLFLAIFILVIGIGVEMI